MTVFNGRLMANPDELEYLRKRRKGSYGYEGPREEEADAEDPSDPLAAFRGLTRGASPPRDFDPRPVVQDDSEEEWDKGLAESMAETKALVESRKKAKAGPPAAKGKGSRISVGLAGSAPMPHAFEEIRAPGGDSGMEAVASRSPLVARHLQQMMTGAAGAKPPTGDEELLAAQARADENRFGSRLAQAGRIIGRAGIAKNPQAPAMDAQAMEDDDRPVQNLMAQRKESRAAEDQQREGTRLQSDLDERARKAKIEGTDFEHREEYRQPGTSMAKRRIAELVATYPKVVGKMSKEQLNGLSAEDVDVLFKELQQERAVGATRAGVAAQNAWLKRLADAGKGSQAYGEMDIAIERLEQLAPGITSGKPGAGGELGTWNKAMLAVPGGFGEGLTTGNTAELKTALEDLAAQLRYMRSGKAVTDAERADNAKLFGLQIGQDPGLLSKRVQQVVSELRQRQQNFQAPYTYGPNEHGQTPLDALEAAGGSTYRQPTGGGAAPVRKQGKDGKMYEKRGGQWFPVQ